MRWTVPEGLGDGNIGAKPHPIRLLALYPAMSGSHQDGFRLEPVAAHKSWRINRFAARQYCALACERPSEDNCSRKNSPGSPTKRSRVFAATLSQEINDCRR